MWADRLMAISQTTDTIAADTTLLRSFRENPDYDYSRDFVESDFSLIDKLLEWFRNLFNTSTDAMTTDEMGPVWIMLGVVILVGAIVYLYVNKAAIFSRSGDKNTDYEVDEDIYGIDFDGRIAQAEAAGNWREASRLTYLQALRWLADNNRIQWLISKTPAQYTHEERSPLFSDMTREFVRVRYGNFDASEDTYRHMSRLREELIETISRQIIAQQGPSAQAQEGGEP